MKGDILKKIAKHLKMRFPTSQISKDLNYSQGVISQYLNNKKEISENFKEDFEKFYNVKFEDFEEENEIKLNTEEENIMKGYEKRIAEHELQIEKTKEEIKDIEKKMLADLEKSEMYKKYINGLETKILHLTDIINITLEAQKNHLEEILNLKK